jgi:hypothetical protein
MDDDEMWDGHRMVDERTRQTAYRVRGVRVCDANSNALVYRTAVSVVTSSNDHGNVAPSTRCG